MSNRVTSRYLLSLLILWQLVASALAHPLELPVHSAPQAVVVDMTVALSAVSESMEEHCAEHQHMSADADHQMDMESDSQAMDMHAMQGDQYYDLNGHDSSGHASQHPCKSACKCPCAGTPALVASLPTLAVSKPEGIVLMPMTLAPRSMAPAKLLRPPIA
ncbi:MAG: hypothetical protein QM808_06570 [Steroidobacteraceae bacterium]